MYVLWAEIGRGRQIRQPPGRGLENCGFTRGMGGKEHKNKGASAHSSEKLKLIRISQEYADGRENQAKEKEEKREMRW